MRILYVSYMHPAVAPGGAQQVAYELFQASLTQGHEAFLVCALEATHEAQYGKLGAPIVPVHGKPREYFYFPQFYSFEHLSVGDWRSIRFFSELVQRLKPQVVHFHHYHRIGVESIRAARVAAPEATICLTLHEMMAICLADGQMVKRPNRELCYAAAPISCSQCFPGLRPEFFTLRAARLRAVLEDCNGFVFPSEFVANRYIEWGLPVEKCAVIPNGQVHPAPTFDTNQHAPNVNRFGFFGQFLDNKGIDIILDALIVLARERRVLPGGILLEINGANKEYASSAYVGTVKTKMAELARLNVGPIEIRDRGAYTRQELGNRMRAVDWVLVPSTWWEVFGLVLSEAWMFGRPVIAAAIGGLDERVAEGVNGLKFPVRDAYALANLMASVVGDEKLWRRLNAGIKRNWSDVDMLDAYSTFWRDVGRSTHRSACTDTRPRDDVAAS